jgi:hypothetical protein
MGADNTSQYQHGISILAQTIYIHSFCRMTEKKFSVECSKSGIVAL